jgi:cation:H+ antiporter
MTHAILLFLGAGAVLIVAATFLTRAADEVAERTGIGRVWMGSVLLAAATSLPELSVDIAAVRQGAPDLAAGDLFGSSMANMLILAVLGLVPPRDEIFRRASLDLTLSGALAIVLNAVAALLIFTQSSTVVAGISPGSLLLFLLFVVGSHVVYRQREAAPPATPPPVLAASPESMSAEGGAEAPAPPSLRPSLLRFALATLVIFLIAPTFADSAHVIAEGSGLGTTFFGTLFVGASTSLPEIVTCIAAVRLGAFDLAVGNLFGSNVFNMTIFLAMDLASPGTSIFAMVNQSHVVSAFIAMILMALGIASIVFRAKRRFALVEPGSVLMVIGYVAGLVALYRVNAGG